MPTVFPPQPILQLVFLRREWQSLYERCWPAGGPPLDGNAIALELHTLLIPFKLGFDPSLLTFVAFHLVASELQAEALHYYAAPLVEPGEPMMRVVLSPGGQQFYESGPIFEPVQIAYQATGGQSVFPSGQAGIPIYQQGSPQPIGHAQPAPSGSRQVATGVSYNPGTGQLQTHHQPAGPAIQRQPMIFRSPVDPTEYEVHWTVHRDDEFEFRDVQAIRNDGQPAPSGWRDRPPLL